MAEEFDIGPLTWVKDEIDQALKSVLDNLEAFAANPGDSSVLRFSKTHLFQVSGALDMVGLQGCKRFCAEIEKVIARLEKKAITVSAETIETLGQSIHTLDLYLKGLLNGSPDTPLALFPALKRLAELHGESVTESELFFPDTSIRAPKNIPTQDIDEEKLPSEVARQRTAFQMALLQWLKTSSADSLKAMGEALEHVQKIQKQAAQKTFWWVSGIFTEALAQQKNAENNAVKLLCRQIDQQLRSLSQGNAKPSGNLLRDMLFYIAQSEPLTERIGQVKALFELDALLPKIDSNHLSPLVLSDADIAIFAALRDMVANLKTGWAVIAEGRNKELPTFLNQLGEAVFESQKFSQQALPALLETFHGLTTAMQNAPGKYGEHTLVEVAAGLNLLQDVLASEQVFDRRAVQELQLQEQRLQAILNGEISAEPTLSQVDEGMLTAMARQIRNALQIVEKSLDTFFRNPADRDSLKAVANPLDQVIAAFDLLDMATPTRIAAASAKLIEHFNTYPALAQETAQHQFDLVAESLSMLGFFVDEFPRIRPETLSALDAALSRLESGQLIFDSQPVAATHENTANQHDAGPDVAAGSDAGQNDLATMVQTAGESAKGGLVKDELVKAEPTQPGSASLDAEILAIFIAEAEEVLATVAQHLQVLRVNSTDHGALAAVRRGYHTLKGSGQTVGLADLSEIARAIEKLLNVVLESNVTPSANQLRFVEKVTGKFSGWIADLVETGKCAPGHSEWTKEAEGLEAESATQKPASEAAEVLIGGTRKISRALFNIFMGEARQHLQSLRNEYAKLQADPLRSPGNDLIRSAHTLASNAGAMGFKPISSLARALENWLDVFNGEWQADSLKLLGNVITSLGNMIKKVEAFAEPRPAYALLKLLAKATESAGLSVPEKESALVKSTDSELTTFEQVGQADSAQADLTDSIVVGSPLNQELMIIFVEEARELVPQIGNELRAWRKSPSDVHHPDALQRALHTLKGSARMAGQSEMANVVHGMEDRIIQALKRQLVPADFDDMFQDVDQISAFLEDLTATDMVGQKAGPGPARASSRRSQFLRLRAEVLDRLINEAGEISIARSRMEQEMQSFKHLSLDLTESVFRLRNYLRELEIETESQMQSRMTLLQETQEAFDPLEFDRFTRLQELTRMMAESVNDVSTIQNGLLSNLNETESALQQQSRMNRELQYGLMDVRMVLFSVISERLHRIVRQTANELNKPVEMTIDGESVDIDRSVLDKIGAPLEHLLRNSVSHGIEPAEQRKKHKKSATGSIQLKVKRESDEIIMTVTDDGAGINLDKVREKAIENGLILSEQAISEQNLLAVIFEPGFSTATDVTQISGRGVGLDAVRGEVTALGGRIEVSNLPDRGAIFTIYLPVTLSVAQVVMVRSGVHMYALPSIMVEQLQKLKTNALAEAYADNAINWADRAYPIHYFSKLIGEPDAEPEHQTYAPILLLRSGTNRIALHVDEILGNQEVVMKQIGTQLARVPGITGATVMGDGKIVLIVNPVQMANREVIVVSHAKTTAPSAVAVSRKTVMVVDDSLTMRKVLSRTLEREGYHVITAKDGMDALQALQETRPDIILLDIEMPRMDGFEFARNVRGDALTADIPIIMISSRTAEKHQSHAKEIGVNAFLGKPVQDEDLLAQINTLLNASVTNA